MFQTNVEKIKTHTIYCRSTTTMFVGTHFSVKLYVHCLYCLLHVSM